jgi:hypothetical protein
MEYIIFIFSNIPASSLPLNLDCAPAKPSGFALVWVDAGLGRRARKERSTLQRH